MHPQLKPYFFSKEELVTSNTDGSHEKEKCLNGNKLNSSKILVFSKFPVTSSEENDKAWRLIKGKINFKCRAIERLVQDYSAQCSL